MVQKTHQPLKEHNPTVELFIFLFLFYLVIRFICFFISGHWKILSIKKKKKLYFFACYLIIYIFILFKYYFH